MLLRFFSTRGVRVELVEDPRSPPVRTSLASSIAAYHETMRTVADRFGAVYVDPNDETPLENRDFFNMLHMTPAGAEKYMRTVANHLAEVLPDAVRDTRLRGVSRAGRWRYSGRAFHRRRAVLVVASLALLTYLT